METISLKNPQQRLTLNEGQLVLHQHDQIVALYPVATVRQIAVYGNTQITTQAIKCCLKEGIRILYFNVYDVFLGKLEPDYPGNLKRKMRQYQIFCNPDKRLAWAKMIVKTKIQCERIELRRWSEHHISISNRAAIQKLKELERQSNLANNLTVLYGCEGSAARLYFSRFPEILPSPWTWKARRAHPAPDPLNCLLSFCYWKTANLFREQCELHGLDRHCGFYHEPCRYGGGLPYDLLEPLRAVHCDHLALRLIRNGTIRPEDFQVGKKETRLKKTGREKFSRALRHHLHIRYPYQRHSMREVMDEMISQVIRFIDSEGDIPDFATLFPVR